MGRDIVILYMLTYIIILPTFNGNLFQVVYIVVVVNKYTNKHIVRETSAFNGAIGFFPFSVCLKLESTYTFCEWHIGSHCSFHILFYVFSAGCSVLTKQKHNIIQFDGFIEKEKFFQRHFRMKVNRLNEKKQMTLISFKISHYGNISTIS